MTPHRQSDHGIHVPVAGNSTRVIQNTSQSADEILKTGTCPLRYRIISPLAERVTPQDPLDAQVKTFYQSHLFYGLVHINRTGRFKSACGRQPGRNIFFIAF